MAGRALPSFSRLFGYGSFLHGRTNNLKDAVYQLMSLHNALKASFCLFASQPYFFTVSQLPPGYGGTRT